MNFEGRRVDKDWIVILTAVIAAAPGVYAILQGRRKIHAEAADSISDAAIQLVEPLRSANVALQQQVEKMRAELDTLRSEVDVLRTENATLRGDVMQLRDDNTTLRTAIAALRERNAELEAGVEALARQVETFGQRPVFTPRKR